jgi:hypothetical protein
METKALRKVLIVPLGGVLLASLQAIPGQEAKPPVRVVPGARQVQTVRPSVVAQVSLDTAKNKVISELYKGQLGRRALFAQPNPLAQGARINGWRAPDEMNVPAKSYFFFVDEMPGANWEHPARYVLVREQTGAVESRAVKTPPRDLSALRPMSPQAEREMIFIRRNASSLLAHMVMKPIVIPKRGKYAVLLSGGWDAGSNYSRYWNDLSSIYKALRQKYRYTDDEIIVLYANGTHSPNADLDGNGTNDVDYAATKANLTTVFNTVATYLNQDGKFFFYSTNHGGQESGHDAILYLWGEWIRDDELAALSKKIVAREAIYVQEQCFSGGMMDDLLQAQTYPCTKPRVCVMTAASYDEVSWSADTEGDYDEYAYYWTAAVFGKTPSGTVVNADANGDGIVSMKEAHEYAKSHDSRSEHPQIGSCVNIACDTDLMGEVGFNPDCVNFNPTTTTAAMVSGRWKVVDGSHWLFDFGSNATEAKRTLEIIKHYQMSQSCFVGRPNPSFQYMLVSGHSPMGAMSGEDCVSFSPATTTVGNVNGRWKVVDGSHWLFDFASNKAEADQTLEIIKNYGFNRSCFVGRPKPSFSYMRK